ncbi:hypothetical protein MJO28_005469 [Puccinia striiformis f. sp. tritici]|uniref:Uncharacterized protein n=1 Tax=Puccinia striiformis f. sp. tritici TaxID=168172 RepID=A0ACC0ELJ3_9BASI|nr:hypothetical protein MJO28_005469 [Puccinia striiformis f. sp. tritici]
MEKTGDGDKLIYNSEASGSIYDPDNHINSSSETNTQVKNHRKNKDDLIHDFKSMICLLKEDVL